MVLMTSPDPTNTRMAFFPRDSSGAVQRGGCRRSRIRTQHASIESAMPAVKST